MSCWVSSGNISSRVGWPGTARLRCEDDLFEIYVMTGMEFRYSNLGKSFAKNLEFIHE